MAFNANVVVLRRKYEPETEEAKKLDKAVTFCLDGTLSHYGIKVDRIVDRSEYDKNTQSNPIDRYIRVRKKSKDQKETTEMVKVGKGKYQHEAFASAKYGFASVSSMGEYTVLWFSFHSRLEKVLKNFSEFTVLFAKNISMGNQTECMVLYTTSFSRSSDLFTLFVNGRERNSLAGKGALTEVKNTYNVDINKVMDNVDQNLAIYYAPIDFAEVRKDMAEQKARHAALKRQAERLCIENKEDGTDMMKKFDEENDSLMKDLDHRYTLVEMAMKSNPMGNVIFFKLGESQSKDATPPEERVFGKKVVVQA